MVDESRVLFFDLDGTLVDSQDGIIESCRQALEQIAPEKLKHLNSIKIGPTIQEIAMTLFGSNLEKINNFIDVFKLHYDEIGVLKTVPYEGVNTLLGELKRQNQNLVIATNKRGYPARKLMSNLGWENYFSWIGCLDESDNPALGKNSIIQTYFRMYGHNENCIFIGDTVSDAVVADFFKMPFIRAAYGYSQDDIRWETIASFAKVSEPLDILKVII